MFLKTKLELLITFLIIFSTYSFSQTPKELIESGNSKIFKSINLIDEDAPLFNDSSILSAIGDYTAAIKIDPNFKEAYYERATAKNMLKDKKGAIEDCNKALRLNPNYEAPHWLLLDLYLEDNRLENAIEEYDIIIGLSPKYSTYSYRAELKSKTGDISGAILDYTVSIQLYPQQINEEIKGDIPIISAYDLKDQFYFRGYNKYLLLDYTGAISDLKMYIHLLDSSKLKGRGIVNICEVYYLSARIYFLLDDINMAIKELSQCIQIASSDPKESNISLAAYYLYRGWYKNKINDKSGACKDFVAANNIDSHQSIFINDVDPVNEKDETDFKFHPLVAEDFLQYNCN